MVNQVGGIANSLLLIFILLFMSFVCYSKTSKLERGTWLNLVMLTILVVLVSTTEVVYGWVVAATDCSYVIYLVTAFENTILFNLSIILAHKAHLVCKDIHDFAFNG